MFSQVSVCPREGGVHGSGGVRAAHTPPAMHAPRHARPLRHAVNDRAVRIILEMHSCLIK